MTTAAIREHWGYWLGFTGRACGDQRADNPFLLGTDAARCWRTGWEDAESQMVAWRQRIEAAQ